ncbi:organic cation transporter protein-like isoform X1 [Rhopalosiphum maidis]|uniref:organic cation transporter protein-like isoform X1 n=1 Tax=Rhopalosiphum maidis TaxID=43146 RepID=UPI00101C914A|nr:organic cation transporter protein-like isoform X1 [Rhopalosiphum maidis]XP_028044483.1 organic cation transporter protein-like isoform X1 [Rhopalosiphum maidis]
MADDLDKYIDSYSRQRWQVFVLLLMAGTPGIFNAIQISSYVFLVDKPSYWCDLPDLKSAGWSDRMIINVSTPYQNYTSKKIEECSYYDRNYSIFAKNGYNWSMNNLETATSKPCQYYRYSSTKSVVSEWDLVCDNVAKKSNIQASMAVGKFVGGLLFGSISDIYGRKFAFNLAALIYMFTGPSAALIDSYVLFLIARFLIGVAGSGIYESSYTILTELTSGKTRTLLCLLMNMSYPIGYVLLSIIAYYVWPWRMLLLILSLPMFGLLIQCWFLPESPKWLMSQGKKKQALIAMAKLVPSVIHTDIDNDDDQDNVQIRKTKKCNAEFLKFLSAYTSLFSNMDLSAKTVISLFCGLSCGLSYYVIALNGDNITADRYVYVALNGIVEGVSYVFTVPLLLYVGRKKAVSCFFFISGILQLILLAIPQEKADVLLGVTLIAKFFVSALFSIIILFVSELYPTTIRNTGIGMLLTFSQIGSIIAPYIVELLGAKAWYIPSTVCGTLGIFVSSLVLMLPETNKIVLPNTLEDMKNTNSVKFSNCFKF